MTPLLRGLWFGTLLLSCVLAPVFAEQAEVSPIPAPVSPEPKPEVVESFSTPQERAARFPLPPEHFEFVEDSYKLVDEAMRLDWDSTEEILDALKDTPQEELDKLADTNIGYRDLLDQPASYRGKVVNMSGVYYRVTERFLAVHENWFLQQYRHLYFQLEPRDLTWFGHAMFDLNDHVLYPSRKLWFGQIAIKRQNIVNFLSTEPVPKTLTAGDGARVVGVFLKRFAYNNSEDGGKGVTWAPLVIIKTLNKQLLGGGPLPNDPMFDLIEIIFSIFAAGGLMAYAYGRWKNKHAGVKYFSMDAPTSKFPGKSGAKRLFGRR